MRREPNILIIGNLHRHPSCEASLKRFLSVLCPLSNSLCLISGDMPPDFRGNVQWIGTRSMMDDKTSILIRLINS